MLYQLSYTHPMRQKGFEPLTHGLEGRCSIQLSYWRPQGLACQEYWAFPPDSDIVSGRADLNGRPPAPKAGALPGCATPRHGSVPVQREGCAVLASSPSMPSAAGQIEPSSRSNVTSFASCPGKNVSNGRQNRKRAPNTPRGQQSQHSRLPIRSHCADRERPHLPNQTAHPGTSS